MSQRRGSGSVGTGVLLLVLGLAIGLFAAELVVRVLDLPPRPLEPLHVGSYRLSDDPILRYEYQPNLAADHAPFEPMHRGLSTNSRGFRDVEFPARKPAGGLRILALGDSTTAGLGIPELANTWPKHLERRLREAQHLPVEVLNLGVGGYDPLQEAELLRVRGLPLGPDVVLVLVCLNDFHTGVDGGVYEALRLARRHLDAPGRDASGVLMRHSRLFFFALHRLRSAAYVPGDGSRDTASKANPLEAGLVLLRRLRDEHGFRLLVFLLPGLDGPHATYGHRPLHRRMAGIAARVGGIEWIDLLEGMAGANPNLRLLSFDGLHPNRVGQAALAEVILRELRARAALAQPGGQLEAGA